MKKLLFLIFFCPTYTLQAQQIALDKYNVIWKTQSKNSSESMPCGGGDIGLNVWVENGDVLFYIARSGTFDENNAMLKLGRVRIKLSSNPFNGNDFKQELHLKSGVVTIEGGNTLFKIWVDVFNPIVHVDLQSKKAITMTAAYESWRYEDHVVKGKELRQCSYKAPQKFDVITYKDNIGFNKNEVLFCHRNRGDKEDIFDYTVRLEKLDSIKNELFKSIKNMTFGGSMSGKNMVAATMGEGKYADANYKSWAIKSAFPSRQQSMEIALYVAQTNTLQDWQNGLQEIINQKEKQTAYNKSQQWWKQFWQRSYVFIDGEDTSLARAARNYMLFRYQLGCNAYGKYPTKFNGGLFTFDPRYVDTGYAFSPDFRLWGGGTMTAQNQRLVYHPFLKNGDFDMLKPQFDFYLNTLKNAELRTRVYWGHNGASFTEQIENFGLPNITEYDPFKRPAGYDAGMEYNAWLEYDWETVFEFCLMMLETERYEARDINEYLPLIESCLSFYDEHYQYLAKKLGSKAFDQNGKYILYPGSALETYKMAYNSTTTIASLKVILERVLSLPPQYLTKEKRDKWAVMLKRVPPISFQQYEGHVTIAPAQVWQRIQNSEAPQLYPVYPWGIYGVGKPGLDTAINTYRYDTQVVKYRSHVGWRQYNIFAARLGLTEEAVKLNAAKFGGSRHRYPTFWGPGFDWTPDHNWGGSAMIGLQEMLMQVDDKKIYLLPAWPAGQDVSFKLHAPYNTTVECVYKNGKVESLIVTPQSRTADVQLMIK